MRALAGFGGMWSDHAQWQLFDKRHTLPLCIAVSLTAHLLLLEAPATSKPPRQAAHSPARSSAGLQVRVLQDEAVARSGTTADERTMTLGARTPSNRSSSVGSHAARPPEQKPGPPDKADMAALPGNAAKPSSEADVPTVATPAATRGDDEYVPRPLLSVPPVAQSLVIIAAPEGLADLDRHVGILSLFIDEDGRVHHVSADEAALPPAFEQAAREAFMAARFSPGQIDGRLVKSRVRVEVVFDSIPLLPAAPLTSPSVE
ncbi:energy transducer TonB [Variovorax sp. J22P271]|uniref:energy transducer TonB n=1 Tax=Variovorax davisae TaxID=3053515 RepID=UPI0025782D0E|nr:energy transducer TonB [Variovorax sp. J22P271]MDM0035966.1 energy transducer TonB [Variovorax sp. J22P271]